MTSHYMKDCLKVPPKSIDKKCDLYVRFTFILPERIAQLNLVTRSQFPVDSNKITFNYTGTSPITLFLDQEKFAML